MSRSFCIFVNKEGIDVYGDVGFDELFLIINFAKELGFDGLPCESDESNFVCKFIKKNLS